MSLPGPRQGLTRPDETQSTKSPAAWGFEDAGTAWSGWSILSLIDDREDCLSIRIAAVALLCAFSTSGFAIELRALFGGWHPEVAGFVTDRGETFDFQDDLGLDASGRRSVLLELDTGRGLWPDWSAGYSPLAAAGAREHQTGILVVPGQTRRLAASADFEDYDLTARYPLRWRALQLSLGLSAKRLSGVIVIEDSEEPAPRRERYDEVFPQLHAGLRWRLGSLMHLVGQAQGVEYEGSRALEYRAVAELRVLEPLLLELGWQKKRYRISLSDYVLDAKLDGLLLRVGFLFRR